MQWMSHNLIFKKHRGNIALLICAPSGLAQGGCHWISSTGSAAWENVASKKNGIQRKNGKGNQIIFYIFCIP